MTYTAPALQAFLAKVPPFDRLPSDVLSKLAGNSQLLRYRMGQAILVREKIPNQVAILYEGQARLLGYDPQNQLPETLKLFKPGEILGWVGLVRGIPCETAIASTETVCLTLPAQDFLVLLNQVPAFGNAFRQQVSLIEIFDLLGGEIQRQATGNVNLRELALQIEPEAIVRTFAPGKVPTSQLDADYLWLLSGGQVVNLPIGSRFDPPAANEHNERVHYLEVTSAIPARFVGFRMLDGSTVDEAIAHSNRLDRLEDTNTIPDGNDMAGAIVPTTVPITAADIPYAPDSPPDTTYTDQNQLPKKYPYIYGKGNVDGTMACFQMLSRHLNVPFRRDTIRRVLINQLDRTNVFSLELCGAIAELMGLQAQLVTVPAAAINRLEGPALIRWQEGFAILYETSPKELVLGIPEIGVVRRKLVDFLESWGEQGQVLLLKRTKHSPQQKFGLNWFLPSLYRYRNVLMEVFVASFFVQLFGLANPLMVQIIIDTVIVNNSIDTLHVLGVFLLVVAVFEAVLTSLRTYLFVDTTNRIDLALGSEIIDHLLRLPLRYFERRPVGELTTRINELENIRQFLTGTALTVVLDAVFSVIYIVVMLIYSWVLTLVTLATIPLFVALTLVVSPLVRQQLRTKAERNAETQSYLVEVLSGIQTVKAQNIELRSRWYWQERYARYISAGFNTVLTSTTAGSTSNFLNKLSGLLVLWVGAYLVLQGELTLGQLIAFRIISSYVTSPLLRLTQLWQNFQETALSIERLSDIVDAAPEADETDRGNIPMPVIQGAVKYDNLLFRFGSDGPPQLNHVNLELPAGVFVGIVGQSGSGKSTLMKLLPRLYDPNSGRILIDGYDISKVELYSLRRQIGIVPQDTLLFDGSVKENIALTHPDASDEEIVEAARIAAAHDFIMTLPNGYNSRVGERGSALSGGQRQRIAIARTVLQNPRLIILDEATSALDYDSERQVCLNLAEACRDRTVFFITHRLSSIRNADVILMMDQGSIVEQGTHEELMALKGRYYCLYQQQDAQL